MIKKYFLLNKLSNKLVLLTFYSDRNNQWISNSRLSLIFNLDKYLLTFLGALLWIRKTSY